MSTSLPSEAEIRREFQRLLAEWRRLESKVTTKEELAAKKQEQAVVDVASTYTVESIVKGLADLQLAFDGIMDRAANKLTDESSKLEEVQQAIEVERRRLQELYNVEVAANALDILVQEHETQIKAFEEETTQKQETFEQEVSQQRETWEREQTEFEEAEREHQEHQEKERALEEEEYNYELVRQRQIQRDEYETLRRQRLHELSEEEARKQKDWTTRDAELATHQEQLVEYKAKIDAFPQELEEAEKKARDEAIKDGNQAAKVQAELTKKEVEANQKVYEHTIQGLEATIEHQREDIATLTAELKEALKQAQSLAASAISNRKAA